MSRYFIVIDESYVIPGSRFRGFVSCEGDVLSGLAAIDDFYGRCCRELFCGLPRRLEMIVVGYDYRIGKGTFGPLTLQFAQEAPQKLRPFIGADTHGDMGVHGKTILK
jgi:hypothetical protein